MNIMNQPEMFQLTKGRNGWMVEVHDKEKGKWHRYFFTDMHDVVRFLIMETIPYDPDEIQRIEKTVHDLWSNA